MAAAQPTQLPGDRVKKAIQAFCELRADHPEKDRRLLLQKVETQFDLSPLECEFLHRHFMEESDSFLQGK